MPPRARTPKPRPEPERRPAEADGPLCGECWPDGWPEHARAGACAHGSYKR